MRDRAPPKQKGKRARRVSESSSSSDSITGRRDNKRSGGKIALSDIQKIVREEVSSAVRRSHEEMKAFFTDLAKKMSRGKTPPPRGPSPPPRAGSPQYSVAREPLIPARHSAPEILVPDWIKTGDPYSDPIVVEPISSTAPGGDFLRDPEAYKAFARESHSRAREEAGKQAKEKTIAGGQASQQSQRPPIIPIIPFGPLPPIDLDDQEAWQMYCLFMGNLDSVVAVGGSYWAPAYFRTIEDMKMDMDHSSFAVGVRILCKRLQEGKNLLPTVTKDSTFILSTDFFKSWKLEIWDSNSHNEDAREHRIGILQSLAIKFHSILSEGGYWTGRIRSRAMSRSDPLEIIVPREPTAWEPTPQFRQDGSHSCGPMSLMMIEKFLTSRPSIEWGNAPGNVALYR